MGQEKEPSEAYFKDVEKSDLMILGTFHFTDARLDEYKSMYGVDYTHEEAQKDLNQLLGVLKNYGPTKIAVEVPKMQQHILDSLYGEYLEGRFKLTNNEVYLVGFKLAELLGHKKIYAVAAPGRSYEEYGWNHLAATKEKEAYYKSKLSVKENTRENEIQSEYMRMYEYLDKLKWEVSLVDYYLLLNSEESLKVSNGHYLTGSFKMGEGDDYFGADRAINWYSRNLRIYQNVANISEPGADKVLLLIGVGHVPILNFLLESSPDFNKRVFKEFVEK